jgi:hypothetical protein
MKRILKLKNLLRNQKDKYIRNFSGKIESKIHGSEKILEFFQKNFEGNKIELLSTFGKEFPFIERKETTKEIYKIIEERNRIKQTDLSLLKDKHNVIIPFVGYLPGSGKSRNAKELMNVLQKTDKEKELNLLQNGVQILINFGNGYSISNLEDKDIVKSFCIRLILGYFGVGDNFENSIKNIYHKFEKDFKITIKDSIEIILLDLKKKNREFNPYFIVSIDEFQNVSLL